MIGSLRGTLLDRADGEVLVEVAGIGYRVAVSPTTSVTLGDLGSEVFVFVHHHFREDQQTLYGFGTAAERSCFEILIATHGVGPALAQAILSVHDPAALARVIHDDDVDALCLVPGVGKKTAARLLVELTSKLGAVEGPGSAGAPASAPGTPAVASARADVRDALAGLGYGPDEVAAVLRDLPDGGDTSVLLREALQRLAVS